ncbi:MAG: SIMPL domain-containing protein [bacterium]
MNIKMQNKDFFIKAFVVALLTLLVIFAGNELIDWRKQDNVFQVSADASIFAKPDLAKVNLEIIRESNALTILQQQISQASSALIDQLKEIGLGEKDIKTTNYSISPKTSWNRETGESYIYGFRGALEVEVKIRDFNKIDQIIRLAQVKNLSFEIENKDELLAKAREEAIQEAKIKARKIAQEAGVSLGKLVNINIVENQDNIYSRYEAQAMTKEDQGAQIQPGENEIKVYVSLSYEIK